MPVEIMVFIFRLDGHKLSGRLKVLDTHDEDIEQGKEYNFNIINNNEEESRSVLKFCVNGFMKASKITVLKMMGFSPANLKYTLDKFVIMSIDEIYP